MVIAAVCGLVIIPLPAVLQKGSIMREPVGAAPYAMFFAALPLAALWRARSERRGWGRWAPAVAAFVAVALITGVTVHDYFWTVRKSDFVRLIYFSQETSASVYMRSLPSDTYIYFYSDRARFGSRRGSTWRRTCAGEDRSEEFAGAESIPDDPRRPSAFVSWTVRAVADPGRATLPGRHGARRDAATASSSSRRTCSDRRKMGR